MNAAPVDNRARMARIEQLLREAFSPEALQVEDESHLHAGHVGARSGRGHFRVHITASAFSGQSLVARHRAVFAALGTMMETDIHALAIKADAPEDAAANPS